MRDASQSIWRLAVLAIVAWSTACTDQAVQPAAVTPLTVELVSAEPRLHDPLATYRIHNTSDRPLAYQGYGGGIPDCRVAIYSEGKWLERTPAWVECATGREFLTLAPGAEATLELVAERSDLPMRVGVGYWEPVAGDPPPWKEWSWAWSSGEPLDDILNPSDG